MIIGIGSDIIDIRRVEKTLERFGDRFINRMFSPIEIAKAERRKGEYRNYVGTYAKRFAAKEAFMKAMGTGYSHGIHFKNISVENDAIGKPDIKLYGVTEESFFRLTGGVDTKVSVTITDEYPYAFAVVIVESL